MRVNRRGAHPRRGQTIRPPASPGKKAYLPHDGGWENRHCRQSEVTGG